MRNGLNEPGDLDPRSLDIVAAPRRPRRKRGKAKAPEWIEEEARRAEAKGRNRAATAGVMLEPDECGGYRIDAPHENQDAWDWQIHAAFGTRSQGVVRTFLDQLKLLCNEAWSERDQRWKPSEGELNAAIAFITGIDPRTEAEAALAAQMFAIHLLTMRVTANALKWGGSDNRAAATASKLARTYTLQIEALNKLKGKGRSTRQKITVKRESHVHHHQHVHVAGGSQEFGGQPHEPSDPEHESRAALPGANAGGIVLPMSCRQGKGTVLPARRSNGFGRAGG